MKLLACNGYELEKAQPNTSEDFFNRSEVVLQEQGEERTFHVLYVRYFDELYQNFTPYHTDPIFKVKDRDIYFKDIVGLVCMIKNPDYRNRKRLYINTEQQFASFFKDIQFDKLQEIFEGIESTGSYELSSLHFIKPVEQQ